MPRVSTKELRKELAATRDALSLSETLRKGLFTIFKIVEEERDELRRQLAAARLRQEGDDGGR